ncbi:MAG: tyrosine-type recombinase/integrase [Treponema sp.]|nr:tyrosine-type recombinase/integrase [Treponema sp.]
MPETKIINKEIASNYFSDHWCQKLINETRSRKYSVKTQDAYVYFNKKICLTLKKKPEDIDAEDVKKFLAFMENDKNYSASSLNLSISALKFFYNNVIKSGIVKDQKRPNQDKSLPMILSSEEIKKVLNMIKNPKHRLLIMLVYSSGLRVNEVVTLKKEHIDLSRKVIFVKSGKGRKDRYTMLSDKAAFFINKYFECFNIDNWIFPGQKEEKHLSVRAAQHIFNNAVKKASIDKKISIHNLRHTFATHLLETGIDIRYIQSLLGHASLRTTERYTRVAKRNVLSIKSPLDSI